MTLDRVFSIEKCRKKLPQFTTMNVIDGQASLTSYSSLIFYSLTIDNILNIIVLLILAGVTIATLTGENGILTKATEASKKTGQASAEEQVQLEVTASIGTDGNINIEDLNDNLGNIEGLTHEGETIENNPIDSLPATVVVDGNNVIIREDGSVVVSEWTQTGYEITNGEITVKVGDDVLNYDEGTGSTQIETTESGHTEQQTLTTENLGWRILGIGENGGLELISDNPTTATLTLSGETGYLNAEEVLNTACNELYGKGQYAESARSLNVEDVNKLANYDPETYSVYGDLYKYRFSTEAGYMQYSKSTDNGQTWSDWSKITGSSYQTFRMPGSTEIISAGNPKESQEIECTYYYYSISSQMADNTDIANMITKGTGDRNATQWLASRAVSCDSNCANFDVRTVHNGYVDDNYLSDSDGNSNSRSWAVRPVVSLESNIQLEGNSENGWTIKNK